MPKQQNPYEFIMSSGAAPKKSWLPTPANKTQRIIFVAAGGFILLLLIVVGFSVISGGNNGDTDRLLKLAQQHAEIVRVAEIGTEKARSPQARNLAATTKLTLQSSQGDLLDVVNKFTKVGSKELAAGKNQDTDKALETAEQSNRFDEAFIETMNKSLSSYSSELKAVYDASSSEDNKRVYSEIFNQVTTLLPESTTQSN
jgi:hypothetical protein